MNLRTTLRLLIAIAIAGMLLWILQEDPSPAARPAALLERLDIQKLTGLRIERDAGDASWGGAFERREGRWYLVQPIQSRANGAEIDKLVTVLESLEILETISAADRRQRELSLGDFELEYPRVTFQLVGADRDWSLAVGRTSPLGDSVYVRVGGADDVQAIGTNLLEVIPNNLIALRDRTVLSGSPSDVVRLDVEREGGSFLRIVESDGRWSIQEPIQARADTASVEKILDELFSIQILEFVRETGPETAEGASIEGGAAFGLGEGEAVLQITVWQQGDEAGQVVTVGDAADTDEGSRYAGIGGQRMVFTIPSEALEPLLQLSVHALRDHLVYALDPSSVLEVSFMAGESKLSLARADSAWQVVEPVQLMADRELVDRVVQRLAALEVSEYAISGVTNLAGAGLAPPGLTIGVAVTNGATGAAAPSQPPQLHLGSVVGDGPDVYARVEGDEEVCAIDISAIAPLITSARDEAEQRFTDPLHYFDRVMLSLNPEDVRELRIVGERDIEQVVMRGDDGAWLAESKSGGVVKQDAIDGILIALAQLRALRIEAQDPENIAVYGLDDPSLTLTVGLTESAGIQRKLMFGFRSRSDGVFAMLQGQDAVFVLPVPLASAIGAEIIAPPVDSEPALEGEGDGE